FEMSAGIPMFFDSIKEAGTRAAGFGVQLIGNKGVIDLRVDAQTIAHICAGNPFQPTKTPRTWKPITSAGIDQPEPLTKAGFEVSHHISAVRDLVASIEEDRAPLCSAVEGAAVIEMIHAVFASHTQQGRSVSLPLASRTHPFTDWAAS
ncbi:MAG: gfo/Idh/MocA family oxidoreductase, partial [bacterium]|nr:gfo/Idh/MocA family oxidoreductase [bacterium]